MHVKKLILIFAFLKQNGALAERLGTGLQNLLQQFDSARHLLECLWEYLGGVCLFNLS